MQTMYAYFWQIYKEIHEEIRQNTSGKMKITALVRWNESKYTPTEGVQLKRIHFFSSTAAAAPKQTRINRALLLMTYDQYIIGNALNSA